MPACGVSGLKFGIYGDIGTKTCGGFPGMQASPATHGLAQCSLLSIGEIDAIPSWSLATGCMVRITAVHCMLLGLLTLA